MWGYDLGCAPSSRCSLSACWATFILPDMVGGNAVSERSTSGGDVPGAMKVVRALAEVAAFMPAMQFSVPPWRYDAEVVAIGHKFTALRASPWHHCCWSWRVRSLTRATPIVRPLWWIARGDETHRHRLSLSDTLLVAPVLSRGKQERTSTCPQASGAAYKGELFDKTPVRCSRITPRPDEIAYFIWVS